MMSGARIARQFTKRRRERLHEAVTEDVAKAIVSGSIAPGEFLPTEMGLAGQFEVSRTVIREAVKVLATKGLVEVLHGQGVRVLPRHAWNSLDPLVLRLRERDGGLPELLRELLQVRRIVETEVAALAAEMASDEEITELRSLLARMDASVTDVDVYNTLDLQLHDRLATLTHNSLLPAMLRPVSDLLALGREITLRTHGNGALAQAHHREIVDAVARRDPAAARDAMARHLRLFEYDIQRAILDLEGSVFAAAATRS